MVEWIRDIPQLPARRPDAHKGDFGKVLIIGGNRGMVGAPSLAGLAALRSGAGLVRVAVPENIQLAAAQINPCATTMPLAETDRGLISSAAIHDLLIAIEDNDSVVLGPGMGQSAELTGLVETIIRQTVKPMIVDADGLNILAQLGSDNLQLRENIVLTPHPGEMARLWARWFRRGLPVDRTEQAQKLAEQCGAVVVLKGGGTVVTDGKKTYMNETGNPGMATGGTGDVLSGCIGALLALGGKHMVFDAQSAAILSVWAHGQAGDLAAKQRGQTGLIAADLLDYLPQALGVAITSSSV